MSRSAGPQAIWVLGDPSVTPQLDKIRMASMAPYNTPQQADEVIDTALLAIVDAERAMGQAEKALQRMQTALAARKSTPWSPHGPPEATPFNLPDISSWAPAPVIGRAGKPSPTPTETTKSVSGTVAPSRYSDESAEAAAAARESLNMAMAKVHAAVSVFQPGSGTVNRSSDVSGMSGLQSAPFHPAPDATSTTPMSFGQRSAISAPSAASWAPPTAAPATSSPQNNLGSTSPVASSIGSTSPDRLVGETSADGQIMSESSFRNVLLHGADSAFKVLDHPATRSVPDGIAKSTSVTSGKTGPTFVKASRSSAPGRFQMRAAESPVLPPPDSPISNPAGMPNPLYAMPINSPSSSATSAPQPEWHPRFQSLHLPLTAVSAALSNSAAAIAAAQAVGRLDPEISPTKVQALDPALWDSATSIGTPTGASTPRLGTLDTTSKRKKSSNKRAHPSSAADEEGDSHPTAVVALPDPSQQYGSVGQQPARSAESSQVVLTPRAATHGNHAGISRSGSAVSGGSMGTPKSSSIVITREWDMSESPPAAPTPTSARRRAALQDTAPQSFDIAVPAELSGNPFLAPPRSPTAGSLPSPRFTPVFPPSTAPSFSYQLPPVSPRASMPSSFPVTAHDEYDNSPSIRATSSMQKSSSDTAQSSADSSYSLELSSVSFHPNMTTQARTLSNYEPLPSHESASSTNSAPAEVGGEIKAAVDSIHRSLMEQHAQLMARHNELMSQRTSLARKELEDAVEMQATQRSTPLQPAAPLVLPAVQQLPPLSISQPPSPFHDDTHSPYPATPRHSTTPVQSATPRSASHSATAFEQALEGELLRGERKAEHSVPQLSISRPSSPFHEDPHDPYPATPRHSTTPVQSATARSASHSATAFEQALEGELLRAQEQESEHATKLEAAVEAATQLAGTPRSAMQKVQMVDAATECDVRIQEELEEEVAATTGPAPTSTFVFGSAEPSSKGSWEASEPGSSYNEAIMQSDDPSLADPTMAVVQSMLFGSDNNYSETNSEFINFSIPSSPGTDTKLFPTHTPPPLSSHLTTPASLASLKHTPATLRSSESTSLSMHTPRSVLTPPFPPTPRTPRLTGPDSGRDLSSLPSAPEPVPPQPAHAAALSAPNNSGWESPAQFFVVGGSNAATYDAQPQLVGDSNAVVFDASHIQSASSNPAPYNTPHPQFGRSDAATYDAPQPQFGHPEAAIFNAPQPQFGRPEADVFNAPQPQFGHPEAAIFNAPQPQFGRPEAAIFDTPAHPTGASHSGTFNTLQQPPAVLPVAASTNVLHPPTQAVPVFDISSPPHASGPTAVPDYSPRVFSDASPSPTPRQAPISSLAINVDADSFDDKPIRLAAELMGSRVAVVPPPAISTASMPSPRMYPSNHSTPVKAGTPSKPSIASPAAAAAFALAPGTLGPRVTNWPGSSPVSAPTGAAASFAQGVAGRQSETGAARTITSLTPQILRTHDSLDSSIAESDHVNLDSTEILLMTQKSETGTSDAGSVAAGVKKKKTKKLPRDWTDRLDESDLEAAAEQLLELASRPMKMEAARLALMQLNSETVNSINAIILTRLSHRQAKAVIKDGVNNVSSFHLAWTIMDCLPGRDKERMAKAWGDQSDEALQQELSLSMLESVPNSQLSSLAERLARQVIPAASAAHAKLVLSVMNEEQLCQAVQGMMEALTPEDMKAWCSKAEQDLDMQPAVCRRFAATVRRLPSWKPSTAQAPPNTAAALSAPATPRPSVAQEAPATAAPIAADSGESKVDVANGQIPVSGTAAGQPQVLGGRQEVADEEEWDRPVARPTIQQTSQPDKDARDADRDDLDDEKEDDFDNVFAQQDEDQLRGSLESRGTLASEAARYQASFGSEAESEELTSSRQYNGMGPSWDAVREDARQSAGLPGLQRRASKQSKYEPVWLHAASAQVPDAASVWGSTMVPKHANTQESDTAQKDQDKVKVPLAEVSSQNLTKADSKVNRARVVATSSNGGAVINAPVHGGQMLEKPVSTTGSVLHSIQSQIPIPPTPSPRANIPIYRTVPSKGPKPVAAAAAGAMEMSEKERERRRLDTEAGKSPMGAAISEAVKGNRVKAAKREKTPNRLRRSGGFCGCFSEPEADGALPTNQAVIVGASAQPMSPTALEMRLNSEPTPPSQVLVPAPPQHQPQTQILKSPPSFASSYDIEVLAPVPPAPTNPKPRPSSASSTPTKPRRPTPSSSLENHPRILRQPADARAHRDRFADTITESEVSVLTADALEAEEELQRAGSKLGQPLHGGSSPVQRHLNSRDKLRQEWPSQDIQGAVLSSVSVSGDSVVLPSYAMGFIPPTHSSEEEDEDWKCLYEYEDLPNALKQPRHRSAVAIIHSKSFNPPPPVRPETVLNQVPKSSPIGIRDDESEVSWDPHRPWQLC